MAKDKGEKKKAKAPGVVETKAAAVIDRYDEVITAYGATIKSVAAGGPLKALDDAVRALRAEVLARGQHLTFEYHPGDAV